MRLFCSVSLTLAMRAIFPSVPSSFVSGDAVLRHGGSEKKLFAICITIHNVNICMLCPTDFGILCTAVPRLIANFVNKSNRKLMIRGNTIFVCTKCKHIFKAPDIEYACTTLSYPAQCPSCGSWHTMPPYGFLNWFIYKEIWAEIDKKPPSNK